MAVPRNRIFFPTPISTTFEENTFEDNTFEAPVLLYIAERRKSSFSSTTHNQAAEVFRQITTATMRKLDENQLLYDIVGIIAVAGLAPIIQRNRNRKIQRTTQGDQTKTNATFLVYHGIFLLAAILSLILLPASIKTEFFSPGGVLVIGTILPVCAFIEKLPTAWTVVLSDLACHFIHFLLFLFWMRVNLTSPCVFLFPFSRRLYLLTCAIYRSRTHTRTHARTKYRFKHRCCLYSWRAR
jgi:hypothetical protein